MPQYNMRSHIINYNKPIICYNKTYKGKYKHICNHCLNTSENKIGTSENKKSTNNQICEKPICPDIIQTYKRDDSIYKPCFHNNKKEKENKSQDNFNNFITKLTNTFLNV